MRKGNMKKNDTLQRFLFENNHIRGEIIHLEEVYQTILSQRPYPTMVKHLLGEALAACVLLAGSIKFKGEIYLQFQGDERLPLLLIQCTDDLHLRGFAKFKEESGETINYNEAFLKGHMTLVINQDNQTQTYQSVVPIKSISMSENIISYFAQSEQISTMVWLATNEYQAGGMLLQLMPDQNSIEREQFWEYAVQLGQTVRNDELLTLDNETLLHRLYHESELRLFPARRVTHRCRCTQEKMKQILITIGEAEVKSIIEEQGAVTISCDFCQKAYSFDPIDITLLFKA